MRSPLPREFWLMCAPIALFGAGICLMKILNPPSDPNAKIALTVERDISREMRTGQQLSLGWKAVARGGPSDDRHIGFSQTLIASGHGRSRVIFSDPAKSQVPSLGISSSNSNFSQRDRSEISQTLYFRYDNLPVWTQKLHWRGEVVVVPQNSGTPGQPFGAAPPKVLQQWAQFKGATRVVKTISVPLDAKNLGAISELKLEKVNPANAKLGADTCVTTITRRVEPHAFARLIAFDGHTRRELWRRDGFDPHRLWKGNPGGGSDQWGDSQLFKLRDVPADWGEITYLVDMVVDPDLDPAKAATGSATPCDASEIVRREKAGWLQFSRRLTVRKNGQTVEAPVFSTKPNTQLMGISSALSPEEWIVKIRLRYVGPDKSYDLDGDPWFFELNNDSIGFQKMSYGISDSAKPGEKLMTITIPAKDLGRARKIRMKLEIADSAAAPLVINQVLQIPNTTS